jgi:uncharacterized protein (TIGR02453 family)
MTFSGFPAEAIEWFHGIEANNTRPWFQEHRPMYDRTVRQPLESLLEDVSGEFGEAKVFRPNRDTRFSADKSPYKTNAAASIPATGGGYYLSLSADGLMAGAGMYVMDGEQLARFREAVAAGRTGNALAAMLEKLHADGYEAGGHDELKSAPRGYAKDHPRVDLLRMKGLVVWKQHAVRKWLQTPVAKDRVVEVWRAAGPVLAWLGRNVGA